MTEAGRAPLAVDDASAPPLLEARGITKTFPGVKALEDVDFVVRAGEVHALMGENGAGKSTLMKIFAGMYQPDAGTLYQRGEEIRLVSPLAAHHHGISVIHQELFLANQLTVAQNIFIGREPRLRGGILNDDRAINRMAGELLARLGVDLDPRVQVGRLTVAQQQMVEIAKALSFNSSVLIMDEPTSALTDGEVANLFRIIRDFVTDKTAVVYISHRMDEIQQIADRITVLRDGQYVDSRPSAELSIHDIIRLMVGRAVKTDARPVPHELAEEPVLEVRGLSTRALLRDVSFSLRPGEILGFAGLMGAGRTEMARALVGADPKTSGEVLVRGRQVRIARPADAVRQGIGYLSEDRKRYGLILGQTVAANIALPSLPRFRRLGLLQEGAMRRAAEASCARLGIKTPSVRQQLRNLSGGNQQKVVVAKWLERDCDILIFDEPTRGIDVGAKQEIYELLHELIGRGKSIIVISSELEEVMRVADRIVVMCNGRITGEMNNEDATQERIMGLATLFDNDNNTEREAVR